MKKKHSHSNETSVCTLEKLFISFWIVFGELNCNDTMYTWKHESSFVERRRKINNYIGAKRILPSTL